MRCVDPVALMLAVALGGSVTGSGQAQWTDVASPAMQAGDTRGAAWGDYDRDGDLDLYLTRWGQPNLLFSNEGGVFVDVTTPVLAIPDGNQWSGRAVWGDVDNDGDLDLYLAQSLDSHLLRNDGPAGFTDITAGNPLLMNNRLSRCPAWGDYDNDGDIDVYIGATIGNNNASRLLRNDGGGFVDVSFASGVADPGTGRGVAWADYDNDGDLDLYVANGESVDGSPDPNRRINRLFRNDGAGSFVDVTAGPLFATGHSRGVAWGDYDNDGDFDLYIAAIPVPGTVGENGENKLLRNDAGVFGDVSDSVTGFDGFTRCCSWIDYDNDGDLDLYLVTSSVPCMLLENDGAGNFTNVTTGAIGGNGGSANAAAWADYDNDGDLDCFIAYKDDETPSMLVRNDLTNGHHWLQVNLVGTLSNRSAIGAKLRLSAGGTTQLRQIESGSGYLTQHMLTAHFGLGTNTSADSLTIEWPSGQVQVIKNPAIDQRLTIVEPCIPGVDCDDCNGNGVSDVADIALGNSDDCNFNGIPDECELASDCNLDSQNDLCELALGPSVDCDGDGILDECQLATGEAFDCNSNGVIDVCAEARFPALLVDNTTTWPDTTFIGVPDETAGGLNGAMVTLDFGRALVANMSGPDFTVYELTLGGAEFANIDVLVSLDGAEFTSVKISETAGLRVEGDESYVDMNFARSYDLAAAGLAAARFVRIISSPPQGTSNGFDLDGVGALHLTTRRCGDTNGDHVVDVTDLLTVLSDWGPCPAVGVCLSDINIDGAVNVTDLLIVLSNWG